MRLWTVLVLVGSAACAADGSLVRLTPPEMDVSAAIRTIVERKLPVKGIVVDVARGGQTLFPVADSAFATRKGFAEGDPLAGWIREAHAANIAVVAGVNLWHWWLPSSKDPDPFVAHPELLELDSEISCNPASSGKYASPWHPKVRASLQALARTLGERYPELDGFYIHPTLDVGSWVGFSPAARAAYIRAKGIDPVDIPVFGVKVADSPELAEFIEWRLTSIASLVKETVDAWRAAGGQGPVIARAVAVIPTWHTRYRGVSCADWVRWLENESVTSLALEADLTRSSGINEFQPGWLLYRDWSLTAPTAYLLMPGEQRGQLVPFADSWQKLRAANPPDIPMLIDPATPDALAEAWDLLAAL